MTSDAFMLLPKKLLPIGAPPPPPMVNSQYPSGPYHVMRVPHAINRSS